jgi:predicted Zn-dependent protease with MMP-like domain
MERAQFERLVRQALDDLPGDILSCMDNVDVVVEEVASRDQLIGSGLDDDELLLGLYEGIPLPDRYDYNLVLPDKITLFQNTIESVCPSDEDVVKEVRDTVVHEVAHHFGIGDDELDAMGAS